MDAKELLERYAAGRSNFKVVHLNGAYLREAYLREAYLREAYLREADLTGANLTGATLQETLWVDVCLNALCSASDLAHEGPSTVDYRSIIRSIQAPHLRKFLIDTRIPAGFSSAMWASE